MGSVLGLLKIRAVYGLPEVCPKDALHSRQRQAGYHFEDFVEASSKIRSKEHLFDTFKSFMREHCGFDGMNFSVRRDDEVPMSEWGFGIVNSYTDAWQEFYKKHHCINIDPVYKCAISSYGPFRWQDLKRRLPLSPAQQHLLNLAADAGLHNGQGIPFCGPRTQIAGIALTTSTRSADHLTNLPLLFAFCNQFYLTYKRIVGKIEPRLPDNRTRPRDHC